MHEDLTISKNLVKIEEHTFDGNVLNPESIVVDIGGNQGNFSWEILQRYGCRIEIFEPDVHAFLTIADRMLSDRVIIHPRAVTATTGVKNFYCAEPRSGGNSLVAGHSCFDESTNTRREYNVYSVSMESVLRRLPRIDLLKLDCEGSEFEIIKETPAYLWDRVQQITIEFHAFCFKQFDMEEIRRCVNILECCGFHHTSFDPTSHADSWFTRRQY